MSVGGGGGGGVSIPPSRLLVARSVRFIGERNRIGTALIGSCPWAARPHFDAAR